MPSNAQVKPAPQSVALSAAAPALVGLALLTMPWAESWTNASYDSLFRFGSRVPTNQLVLLEMDTESHAELDQTRGKPWDRKLHAQLLDRLREDACPLVVFDIWFGREREPESDAALADALRRNGHAVLIAELVDPTHPRMRGNQVLPPHTLFRAATTNWGIAQAEWERDGVVRRVWNPPDPELAPSLPWAAARAAGAPLDSPAVEASKARWLRYYGGPSPAKKLSYHLADQQGAGFFSDKIVFVGHRPETPIRGDERDEFVTPYANWTGETTGGVEIMITTFLNLVNGDGLRRLALWQEAILVVLAGGAMGVGFSFLRRWIAFGLGLAAALAVGAGGLCLGSFTNWWFPWLVVAGGQIPVAVGCAFLRRTGQPRIRQLEVPESAEPLAPGLPLANTPGYDRIEPPFGEGAYGKVWLVRNAVGEWQALKVMFRSRFRDEHPYDREFNGIKHYKPLSNQHPGLLRVDFVSAKQPEGYFYYVMELGDAPSPGWEKTPSTYKPRDLSTVCQLAPKKRLPVQECVRIGLALAESLDFLHRQGFIHRDIKPSNIIFVKGQPKLADVGLVTEIERTGRDVSLVGTHGYMPPEGPGEPRGDIYSLGMLLYVVSTGRPPLRSFDVSTAFVDNSPEFMLLNEVLWKACALEPQERYATAAELRDALKQIEHRLASSAVAERRAEGPA